MNTLTSPFSVALDSLNPRRSSTADPYASEAQTTVLLRRGAEYRRQRINASDMITTEEEIDYAIETIKKNVTKLRELSPLWEMYQDGVDLSTIQWAAH